MDAAVLTMITALLAAVLANSYEQRREGTRTRDKLDETNSAIRELAARATILEAGHQNLRDGFVHLRQDFGDLRKDFGDLRKDFGDLRQDFGDLRQDFAEHRRVTDNNHAEIAGSLADARERLARIEGHLGMGHPPPDDPKPDS